MKEIICLDKTCLYNYETHCMNNDDLCRLNNNHTCNLYKKDNEYSKQIKETLANPKDNGEKK